MSQPATERRRPRWERLGPDERRAQILRVARDLFARRQYAAVSMEEIALAAGVRRGLVNHYFGGKRDLFIEVVREMLGSFGRAFPLPARAGAEAGVDAVEGEAEGVAPGVEGGAEPGVEGGAAGGVAGGAAGGAEGGGIERVVADHVSRWLDVVERDAETWFAILGAEGFGRDPDVERLVDRARDAMVNGIVEVLGQPATDELRTVLRAYSGLAEIVTREWLQRHRIDRAQAEALLGSALLTLVRDVVPEVRAAATAPRTGGKVPRHRRATRS